MKKRIAAILLLAVLVFTFTGCMQITYHVTMNNNGTANAEYEMYMDKETVSMIMGTDGETSDPFLENRAAAEAAGFAVTPVETETQIGFKASAENLELNMQDIVNNVGMGGTGDGAVQVKKGLFKNTYTINANVDTTNIFGEDEQSQSIIPLISNSISVKLLFTAPSEIVSDTGTPAKDMPNTYEYNIELGKNNQISLSYTMLNMTNIYICAGIVILLVLFLIFFCISRSKKKKEQAAELADDVEGITEIAEGETVDESIEVSEEAADDVDEEATDVAVEDAAEETAEDAAADEPVEEIAEDAAAPEEEVAEEVSVETDAEEEPVEETTEETVETSEEE